jgi:hypothetical protein
VLAYSDNARQRASGWSVCDERDNAGGGGSSLAWPPCPADDWSRIKPSLWPMRPESSIRGVADGLPSRLDRIRALGNAVVPQQAAHAIRGLIRRALED